jgi:hypothetical protein
LRPTDINTLAAVLERAWAETFPGRETAERNALLRAAQYEAHPRVRQQEMHHERSQPATLRAMSAARICVHRARTDGVLIAVVSSVRKPWTPAETCASSAMSTIRANLLR